MADENLYSINQVAILLKIHQLTVRRYIKEGRLRAVKVGGNIRVPESSIELFTHDVQPTQYGVKETPKEEKYKAFELNDPIFRMKARGLSLKPLNFKS
jgi:excisionase family DNA binding protein